MNDDRGVEQHGASRLRNAAERSLNSATRSSADVERAGVLADLGDADAQLVEDLRLLAHRVGQAGAGGRSGRRSVSSAARSARVLPLDRVDRLDQRNADAQERGELADERDACAIAPAGAKRSAATPPDVGRRRRMARLPAR